MATWPQIASAETELQDRNDSKQTFRRFGEPWPTHFGPTVQLITTWIDP
jgi:hypothetical protein